MKQLHIGPGRDKLPGQWDTLDVRPGSTYEVELGKHRHLPIPTGTYDLIYMSHVIEHIPWWKTVAVLDDLNRILKVGGRLEVWTVDAYKVAQRLIDAEDNDEKWLPDNWRRFNRRGDPVLWCAGRLFAYGSHPGDPNWHKALFTKKHLARCFEEAGFDHYFLDRSCVRGHDHGWINLGICGIKTKASDSGPYIGQALGRDPEATPPVQGSIQPPSALPSAESHEASSDELLCLA